MSPLIAALMGMRQRSGNGGVVAPESPMVPAPVQGATQPPPFQPPPNSMFMGYLPGMTQDMIPKGKSTAGLDFTTQPGMAGWYAPNYGPQG